MLVKGGGAEISVFIEALYNCHEKLLKELGVCNMCIQLIII